MAHVTPGETGARVQEQQRSRRSLCLQRWAQEGTERGQHQQRCHRCHKFRAIGSESEETAVRLCRVGSGDKGGGCATLSQRAFCWWLAVQRLSVCFVKLIKPTCQISSPLTEWNGFACRRKKDDVIVVWSHEFFRRKNVKMNPLPHQPIKMEIFRELTNATGFSYRDF